MITSQVYHKYLVKYTGVEDAFIFHLLQKEMYYWITTNITGSGSSVGLATGYGLDGPGIEAGGGEIFHTCPDRPWGLPSRLYNGYQVFPRG
jgi:hypothetical protein